MSTHIVVTGGSGFLGSALARRLLGEPVARSAVRPGPRHRADPARPGRPRRRSPRRRPGAVRGGRAGRRARRAGRGRRRVPPRRGGQRRRRGGSSTWACAPTSTGPGAVLEYGRRHARARRCSSSPARWRCSAATPRSAPSATSTTTRSPRPRVRLGMPKFIGEQLVADYTRKGFVRGRSGPADDRLGETGAPRTPRRRASCPGSVREPLAGERARCRWTPDTPVALSSPRAHAGRAAAGGRGRRRDVGQPDRRDPARPHHDAARDGRGARPGRRVRAQRPDRLGRRPGRRGDRRQLAGEVPHPRAERLGLHAEETSFDDIVRAYVADNP